MNDFVCFRHFISHFVVLVYGAPEPR